MHESHSTHFGFVKHCTLSATKCLVIASLRYHNGKTVKKDPKRARNSHSYGKNVVKTFVLPLSVEMILLLHSNPGTDTEMTQFLYVVLC